jgi:hypothetical protein
MGDYMDSRLSEDQAMGFNTHLVGCPPCRERLTHVRKMQKVMQAAFGAETPDENQKEKTGRYLNVVTSDSMCAYAESALRAERSALGWSISARLSAAPWWFVSLALHVLIIALAGLLSLAIEPPRGSDEVVMITELRAQPAPEHEKEQSKPAESALASKLDTQPTDPAARELSDIVVPPDILAKAELGDHFETLNPDRPDTHDAYGIEDSKSFHALSGNADKAGGGGSGGVGMADLIGIGGAASKGTGGGFGGGDGLGVGAGTGAGKGSFGNRNGGGRKLMVKRNGGSKATENAVDIGLEWLARHQEADGSWNSVKYQGKPYSGTACTGLALLAFLGAGHTEKVGAYKENVQRAVAYLKSIQKENGSIIVPGDMAGYTQAIATMSMAEAAGMANIPETRAAAQRAVNYCTNIHQNGEGSERGGWRYKAKEDEDLSVSGWFIMALKSAKVARINVDTLAFEGAARFLDATVEPPKEAADPNGYRPAMYYSYQRVAKVGVGHATPNLMTIGTLCRQFMGWSREDLENSVERLVTWGGGPPTWADLAAPIGQRRGCAQLGLYQWYYATLSVFQQGGEIWKKWNEGLKTALLEHQCKNGDENGSWPPTGMYAEDWGRVGQTALSCLCLEVYYRYARQSEK